MSQETRLRSEWSDGRLVISLFDNYAAADGQWCGEWFRLGQYNRCDSSYMSSGDLPGRAGGTRYDGWVSAAQIDAEFEQWLRDIAAMAEMPGDARRAALIAVEILRLFYSVACPDGLVSHCFPLRERLVAFTALYLEDYKTQAALSM